jgi:uncharacterized protein
MNSSTRAPDQLAQQLRKFSQHLRDPAHYSSPPNIEERRLVVYRDLFFNNIESLLAGNFPVIKAILGARRWPTLVRDFFRDHHAQTPLFTEIAREFIQYLETRQAQHNDDPAWLMELAHYEWVELALELSEGEASDSVMQTSDALESRLSASPLAWPLAYQWPVHRISLDYQPNETPQIPTFLLVIRDAAFKIRFIEITALSFRLMEYLSQVDNKTGEHYLHQLAAEAGAEDIDTFMQHGQQMLQELISAGAIYTMPE